MQGPFRIMPHFLRGGSLGAGLVVWLGIAALGTAAAGEAEDRTAGETSAPAVTVAIEDGLVTLTVEGAPLAEVLKAIGDAGGVGVVLRGELDTPVHETFSAQPLEAAIRRLVGDRTLVMITRPVGEDGARAVAEIRVGGWATVRSASRRPQRRRKNPDLRSWRRPFPRRRTSPSRPLAPTGRGPGRRSSWHCSIRKQRSGWQRS